MIGSGPGLLQKLFPGVLSLTMALLHKKVPPLALPPSAKHLRKEGRKAEWVQTPTHVQVAEHLEHDILFHRESPKHFV